jgi:hypothetical protein
MSQTMANGKEVSSSAQTAADAPAVQIGLRLRAVDQSDRAILSNITGVHLGSGFAFVDFGFIEQAALSEATRAARAEEQKNPVIDGRLECRIAMGIGDLAQLARQIEQVISAANKARNTHQPSHPDPLALDPASSLQ